MRAAAPKQLQKERVMSRGLGFERGGRLASLLLLLKAYGTAEAVPSRNEK